MAGTQELAKEIKTNFAPQCCQHWCGLGIGQRRGDVFSMHAIYYKTKNIKVKPDADLLIGHRS